MPLTANRRNTGSKQSRTHTRRPGRSQTVKKSERRAAPELAREKCPLAQAKTSTPIAPHLTAFFEQRLPMERHASENTRQSYAYAFQLLLTFASKHLQVTPSQLAVEQIDAPLVLDFLNDLQSTRGNGSSSRNIRLAAIKSFMHFLEYRVPSAIEQIRRILAIPAKKTESRLVQHLTAEETQALLDTPEPTGWKGIRDRGHAAPVLRRRLTRLRVDRPPSGRSETPTTTQRPHPWQRPQGTVPAIVENDHRGATSLVGSARNHAGAGTVCECPGRILDSLGLRIHSAQPRPNCKTALPLAGNEARAPAPASTHLRLNSSAGHERSSKGRAVAWPREDANHGDVHASGSVGETGSPGIGATSETALRALQGYRQADRIDTGGHSYADQKALKMIHWRACWRQAPRNNTLRITTVTLSKA